MEYYLVGTERYMGISGLVPCDCPGTAVMNLADPELELIDPTPNVHALFVQFDKVFFGARLVRQTVVNWSKRMYSCAGVCRYQAGSCTISLSEPLLKLRPRKDLVETLLHEMIHAYLFVTNMDWDRDGHGPNFQAHMHRINRAAGLNISIYHDFHDEVKLYLTHWWRCNGICRTQRPHFGIVRRSCNRAPGPNDFWWGQHQRTCGGQFIKTKEPEKKTKTKKTTSKGNENVNTINTAGKNVVNNSNTKTKNPANTTGKTLKTVNNNDIKKFVTVSKTSTTVKPNAQPEITNIHTIGTLNNSTEAKPTVFTGQGVSVNGNLVNGGRKHSSVDAVTTVRNVWANKTINNTPTKHKAPPTNNYTPPAKTRKIDDYFPKTSAILKDLYGDDIKVSKKDEKIIISVTDPAEFVDCPVCQAKVDKKEINKHLDICLNTDIVEKLSKENIVNSPVNIKTEPGFSKNTMNIPLNIKTEPGFNKNVAKQLDTNAVAGTSKVSKVLTEPSTSNIKITVTKGSIKIEPSTSTSDIKISSKCVCCGDVLNKNMNEHLDECSAFATNTSSVPEISSPIVIETIVIEDDDLDESQTFNETGTKYPCPCCMDMVESVDMNRHLDSCLG